MKPSSPTTEAASLRQSPRRTPPAALQRSSGRLLGCLLAVLLHAPARADTAATPTRSAGEAPTAASPAGKAAGTVFLPNEARAGRNLSPRQVAQLEGALQANPANPALRARLLGYYYSKSLHDEGLAATQQARRRHVLWIIQNMPGSELAALGEARLAPANHALADKTGYEQARTLWLQQTNAPRVDPRVLVNAVGFLQLHDKALAEKLLDQGATLYPQDSSWAMLRGYLYALAILGINGLNTNGLPVSVSKEEQDGTFARNALTALDTSTSATVVGTAGTILAQYGVMIRATTSSKRDFSELAEKCLLRAQAMEPANQGWATMLGEFYNMMGMAAASTQEKARWSGKALAQMEKAAAQASDPRASAYLLRQLAKTAFNAGAFDKAETAAKRLLDIAKAHPGNKDYGDAVHDGNMVLGRLALRKGDVRQAKAFLLKSGHASGAGTLSSFGPNMSLAKELLERGEKATVIEYLQLCKKFWTYPHNPLDAWIRTIQAGQQPDFSQNLNY